MDPDMEAWERERRDMDLDMEAWERERRARDDEVRKMARREDPITSFEAAGESVDKGIKKAQQKALTQAAERHPGRWMTGPELGRQAGLDWDKTWRRTNELVTKGILDRGEPDMDVIRGRRYLTFRLHAEPPPEPTQAALL